LRKIERLTGCNNLRVVLNEGMKKSLLENWSGGRSTLIADLKVVWKKLFHRDSEE